MAIVVTGASSGIGREISQLLSKKGYSVVGVARRGKLLIELGEELSTPNLMIEADITKEESCRDIINQAMYRFGKIEGIICNAGASMSASFVQTQSAVLIKMMDINYFAPAYLAKHGFPYLLQTKGSLIFVSSGVGKRGMPTRSGYSASKFALQGLFESLRSEWHETGIHVGIVSPGFTDTEIRKSALTADGSNRGKEGKITGKMMSAHEAAAEIVAAFEKRKREVILTLGGKVLNRLNQIFPQLTDKLVRKFID